MEMVYLLCQGNLLEANKVYAMVVTEFLFYSEYLLRKRKIEAKQNKTS